MPGRGSTRSELARTRPGSFALVNSDDALAVHLVPALCLR